MNLQNEILNRYLKTKKKMTLKLMAEDTGIQFTRCFRILNGSRMKLEEYEILKLKIYKDLGLTNSLESLALECSKKLNSNCLQEIENLMIRKLKIQRLKNKDNQPQEEKLKLLA
jgi:hypothetical protein